MNNLDRDSVATSSEEEESGGMETEEDLHALSSPGKMVDAAVEQGHGGDEDPGAVKQARRASSEAATAEPSQAIFEKPMHGKKAADVEGPPVGEGRVAELLQGVLIAWGQARGTEQARRVAEFPATYETLRAV